MSDIHVLGGNVKADRWACAFHITVPDITNDASVSYRAILSDFEDTASAVPGLPGAEQTDLDNGALYEEIINVRTSSDHADRLQDVQDAYNTWAASVLSQLQSRYLFTGKTINVP